MSTETTVSNLKINKLTSAQYATITPSATELYLTDEVISSSDVTTALGYTPENQANKVTTITSSSTDTQYPSAKCVYDAIQAGGGGSIIVDQTYSASSTNAQSGVAINGAKFIQNTATGTNGLTIAGTASSSTSAVNIGKTSTAGGGYSTAVGYYAASNGARSTSIGYGARIGAATADAIQIGYGTNSTANTLSIGFYNNSSTHYNWQLLDGTTGLIPTARIDTDTTATSGSAKPITSDAVYTIVGNIESALNTINSGSGT